MSLFCLRVRTSAVDTIKDIGRKNNKDVIASSKKAGFIIFDEICSDSSSAAPANDFISDSICKKKKKLFLDSYHFYQILFSIPRGGGHSVKSITFTG